MRCVALLLLLAACSSRAPEATPVGFDAAGARIYVPIGSHMTNVAPDEAAGEILIDDQDTFPSATIGSRGYCRPVGNDLPYPRSRECCLGKVCVTEHRSIREP